MKRLNVKIVTLLAALVVATAMSANATVIDLTFAGVGSYPTTNYPQILNFYNGGTSSAGFSGPNYGISFPSNALGICLNTLTADCSNTSKGGLGNPASQEWALFFLTGTSTFLNVPAGFTTGFSFTYTAINSGGSIAVYSGVNGTGSLLASFALPTTPSGPCPGYGAGFCPFFPIGVTFPGTAMSIDFLGNPNQIVFDDITFGSSTPGTPEPGTLVMFGSGVIGLAGLLRRKFNV
jgi:PEP-CTERM motif